MRGASALEAMLAELPEESVRVHVVWMPVLATDVAPPLTSVLGRIRDRRVRQYWDPGRTLSADIVRSVNERPREYGFDEALPPGFIAWDVVAVFGRDVRWERDIPVPAFYDGPVPTAIERTKAAIERSLGGL